MMILKSIDGLVVVDPDGIILYFDDQTAKGMGLKAEDFIGKYVRDMLPLTKIHTVLETKQHDIGDFYFIEDEAHRQHPIVVSTRHPMYKDGAFAGVVEYDLFENYQVLKQFIKTTDNITNELTWFKNRNKKSGAYTIDDLVGGSLPMQQLRREIIKAANSHSTVVITGETGSGKELVAHSIHHLSKRKQNPFVSVNCSAIPGELFESELFGYEEGSFTSARRGGKVGKFELANRGTLFLDEINTLSLAMQPKLLRVLQEKEFDKIGGKFGIPIDVRVICATNQNLEDLIKSSEFREDLYFRLNVIPIGIPPLRDRLEDIPELVYSCIDNLNRLLGRRIHYVEPGVMDLLKSYHWPGNVRELQNVLERAMNNLDASEETLNISQFSGSVSLCAHSGKQYLNAHDPIRSATNAAEKDVIIQALKRSGGNKTNAAKLLKIPRPVLYRKMARLEIKPADYDVTD